MIKKYIILAILIVGVTAHLSFADSVTFKSSSKTKSGEQLELAGILTKPKGNGPFPAVVLLHGCTGLQYSIKRSESWSNRLVSYGYVTLQVDSFGPRGISNICTDAILSSMFYSRAQDAYDAKSFLAELSFVDRNRIAMMGWSHGGGTVLKALNKWTPLKNKNPFRAAIAFYPWCETRLKNMISPLMILIGERDDWTFASMCSKEMPSEKTEHEIILKIYPGAYHNFDWEGVDEIYEGHRLLYDPVASQDAIIQVKDFLAKYFK